MNNSIKPIKLKILILDLTDLFKCHKSIIALGFDFFTVVQ